MKKGKPRWKDEPFGFGTWGDYAQRQRQARYNKKVRKRHELKQRKTRNRSEQGN